MGFLKSLNFSSLKLDVTKKIGIYSLIPITAASMLFIDGSAVQAKSTQFNTIYHVFYGDEKVGIVDNKEIITDFEEDLLNVAEKKNADYDFSLSEEIMLIRENVFISRTNNSSTLAKLKDIVEVKAESYEIFIDDDMLGHIPRATNMEDFKNDLILDFVDEEALEGYENFQDDDLLDIEVGQSLITNIDFSEEVEWEESLIGPDDMLEVEEALKIMKQGTLETELYTVKQGDVLGTIANNHGLSTKELLQINPNIDEGSLLHIGDELNVTVLVPLVNVIVEKVGKKEAKIPFETEVKEDNNMWQGDIVVKNEGTDGKKIIEYATTYENGQSISNDTLSEDVVKDPVNKIVVKGTKTSPSRGSGNLSWPAVGGYISSYQGPRWGSYHKGIDIARPSNRAILAADNGTVTSAGYERSYGNVVRINHNNGIVTVYAHLQSINVKRGQTVGKGREIGRMGSTGNSTGVHLHFEVYKNGALQNPMTYLR